MTYRYICFVVPAALLLALITCVGASVSHAAASQLRTQAPGYYRLMVGTYEITALSDGTKAIPWDTLIHQLPADDMAALTQKAFLTEPVENSSAAYLVNTGTALILIDTGAGQMWDSTLGKVVTNLTASGYRPDQIDSVLITHLHFDHVGGLVRDGKAVFPSATIWVNQREADFWLNNDARAKAPESLKPWFDKANAAVSPYVARHRFKTFVGSTSFAPGVSAVETFGHTPGDTSYAIESVDQKLVVWGDLVHFAAVQFAHPEATVAFDLDEPGNAAQRKGAMKAAANGGFLIAGSHIPFPGIGHVAIESDHYTFVPVNYTTIFRASAP